MKGKLLEEQVGSEPELHMSSENERGQGTTVRVGGSSLLVLGLYFQQVRLCPIVCQGSVKDLSDTVGKLTLYKTSDTQQIIIHQIVTFIIC